MAEIDLITHSVLQFIVSQFWTGVLCFEILVLSSNLNLQIELSVLELSLTQRLLLSVPKSHHVLVELLWLWFVVSGVDGISICIVLLIALISLSAILGKRVLQFLSSVFWV